VTHRRARDSRTLPQRAQVVTFPPAVRVALTPKYVVMLQQALNIVTLQIDSTEGVSAGLKATRFNSTQSCHVLQAGHSSSPSVLSADYRSPRPDTADSGGTPHGLVGIAQ